MSTIKSDNLPHGPTAKAPTADLEAAKGAKTEHEIKAVELEDRLEQAKKANKMVPAAPPQAQVQTDAEAKKVSDYYQSSKL